MIPEQQELELRAHIRNLLLIYAKTHLAQDYITLTEDAVSDLLSQSLTFIPTADPTSLTLPEDPFDVLLRTEGILDLEPYNETWTTEKNAIELIRRSLTSQVSFRTKRCWDSDDGFDFRTSIYRPMSPILTTQAARDTPKPGCGLGLKSMPVTYREALEHLSSIDPQAVEEPPRIKLDDALNVRLAIDAATHSSMKSLFKSVPTLFPSQTLHVNSHIEAFTCTDSPPPSLPLRQFVPLFCRRGRMGSEKTSDVPDSTPASVPTALSDLRKMLPETNLPEEEDKDLYEHHMVVVDGWQTFASSSPSGLGTPSLHSGTSETDELFLASPINTQVPLIQELTAARIHETVIPRDRDIGRVTTTSDLIGQGQSLGSFLSPYALEIISSKGENAQPRVVTTPQSSPQLSAGLSIIGQPSLFHGGTVSPMAFVNDSNPVLLEPDFDVEIRQLCAEVVGADATDFILKEKLNKEDGLLMDVPIMPQPNSYISPQKFLPTCLTGLADPPKSVGTGGTHDNIKLKCVKGLKSLHMELSWRPVHFASKIPTDEEAAQVDKGFQDNKANFLLDVDHAKVTTLLDGVPMKSSDSEDRNLVRSTVYVDDDDGAREHSRLTMAFDIQLSRQERRRLAGESDNEVEEHNAAKSSFDTPDRAQKFTEERVVSTAKTIESDGLPLILDDSGIYLAHPSEEDITMNEDKENVPPGPGLNYLQYTQELHLIPQPDDGQDQLNFELGQDEEQGSFIPLSFESRYDSFASTYTLQGARQNTQQGHILEVNDNSECAPSEESFIPKALQRERNISDKLLLDTTLAAPSLASYLAGRYTSVKHDFPRKIQHSPIEDISARVVDSNVSDSAHGIPDVVFDRNTLILPSPWLLPTNTHRYLASIDIIQKRSIVRSLNSPECEVQLVERYDLHGVDLILDPHTAVIFVPLSDLPTECDSLNGRLGDQSWHFSRILVIFETFSHSSARRGGPATTEAASNAFTHPILKAIKKLRRDLGIAEAFGTKNTKSSVHLAFPTSAIEAAMFTRCFGDCAEVNDPTGGAIWGTREWLKTEELEGEQDLAGINGMNVFAAFVMLYHKPLAELLNMAPEERVAEFGELVGRERIESFNEILQRRYQQMQSPISSSPSAEAFKG